MNKAERQLAQEPQGGPRPWEEPGATRRDVAPHRGEFLRLLATISLGFSVAGVLLAVPAVVGVPLAFVVSRMASRDLDRMGGGRLDPRGRADTHAAQVRACVAFGLGIAAPFACGWLWYIFFSVMSQFS
jgi:hypothetical protein